MKNDRTLNLSEQLERGVRELAKIFINMRELELTHVFDPSDRDITDHSMLVDDMRVILRQLTDSLSAHPPSAAHPAALASSDFPPPESAHPAASNNIPASETNPPDHAHPRPDGILPPGR
ncbi:hypothetical protein SMC26_24075 [Actinomadura fulvescens]|uniref:Uncharacterized protein n=1 Tax=Actinomadura fulvescens TaxID=46160 RepID=A0ABN3Q2Q2_9ACTN